MMQLFTPRRVHGVSELISEVKKLNERQFVMVWVEGEIKGFTRAASGHLYFSLSDGKASLRVVMFRGQAGLLRFTPKDGQKILCRGQVSVYPARGELQFMADTLEPKGLGAETLALAQLKERLANEGLFSEERKRKLPFLPKRILLLTSLSGAALHDFIKVIERAPSGIQVKIWPILVQGEQALAGILAAFGHLPQWGWPQVVVLTRGGGSSQDLAVFNQEALARAVAASPVPVLSAVGHEIDTSLCDMVADVRAATPTAAAEILLAPWVEFGLTLASLKKRLDGWVEKALDMRQMRLDHLLARLRRPALEWQEARLEAARGRMREAWQSRLFAAENRLSRLSARLAGLNPLFKLAADNARLLFFKKRLPSLMHGRLNAAQARFNTASAKLAALNPLAVLSRGYALAQDSQGRVIGKHSQVKPGDIINIRLAEGSLLAQVKESKP